VVDEVDPPAFSNPFLGAIDFSFPDVDADDAGAVEFLAATAAAAVGRSDDDASQPEVVSVEFPDDDDVDLLVRSEEQAAPLVAAAKAAIDFSQGVRREDGKICVSKTSSVKSIEREPILTCTHQSLEKCHYTYVTQFSPVQEEVCDETFEKKCQITFAKKATTETVKKCYRPLVKSCTGQGPEQCRNFFETSCQTRYVQKPNGKFVGDTQCEKLPINVCGAGCTTEEGPEECHDKTNDVVIEVPEEVCDLNPRKTCHLATRLVPNLKPKHECSTIPKQVCSLKFSSPQQVDKPLREEWCLDETPAPPGETYDEANAIGDPIVFPEDRKRIR